MQRMNEGMRYRLTAIVAPAGFGKTTVLSQWTRRLPQPVAWVALDQMDNDLVRFWRYIMHALASSMSPGIEERLVSLLQSFPSSSIHTFIDVLINECSSLPQNIALVLDDFHLIADDHIHASLAYLIEHLPGNVHLYIATRTMLPFSTSKWQMRGETQQIDTKQLLFTAAETEQFYREMLPFSLSLQQMEKLLQATEGWVAGLQLVAISLRNSASFDRFIEEFSGTHKHVADYLFHEVFQGLPSDIQEFLLATSILQRVDPAMCDALMPDATGSRMLEKVTQLNLFLQPIDDAHTTYRYHHLFSQFLRDQLKKTAPEKWFLLHRTASVCCTQRGFHDEAVDHAFAAKDFSLATRLLESHIVAVLQRGEFSTLVRWFESFPPAYASFSPFLSLLYAFTLVVTGKLERAEQILQQIEKQTESIASEKERKEVQSGIFFVRANLVFSSGDFQTWFEQADRFDEGLPESPIFYHFNYNTTEPFVRNTPFGLRGMLTADTEIIGKRFRGILESRGWHDSLINLYVLQSLAEGYYEWDRLEESALLLRRVEKAARMNQAGGLLVPNRLTQARLYLTEGKLELAHQTIDEAIRMVQLLSEYHWLGPLRAFRARLYMAEGQIGDAWNEFHLLQITEADKPTLFMGLEYLTLARLLSNTGKEESALRILELLKLPCIREGYLGSIVEISLVQALTESKRGNRLTALHHLHEALVIGEQNRYVRSFLDEGNAMAHLLKEYALQKNMSTNQTDWEGVSQEYLQELQSLFKKSVRSKQRGEHDSSLLTPLTPKETEVLQLLGLGASNKEIAHQLALSEGTVKIYLNRIYSKLDVASRTQALLKAQDLLLIERK